MTREERMAFEQHIITLPTYVDYRARLGDRVFLLTEERDRYENRPMQLAFEMWRSMGGKV